MHTRKYLLFYLICLLGNTLSVIAMEDQEAKALSKALELSIQAERTRELRDRARVAAEIREAEALSLKMVSQQVNKEKEELKRATALSLSAVQPKIEDEEEQIVRAVMLQSSLPAAPKISAECKAQMLAMCGLPSEIDELVIACKDSLMQLKVKSQIEKDGGGSASCGYHALKNGFAIAHALIAKDEKKFSDISLLNDACEVEKLFGHPLSEWRMAIIHNRKKKVIADFIYDTLLSQIAKTEVEVTGKQRPDASMVYKYNLKDKWVVLADQKDNLIKKDCISGFREVAKGVVEDLNLAEQSAISGKQISTMFAQLGQDPIAVNCCLPDLETLVFDVSTECVVEETSKTGYAFGSSPNCLSGEWLTNEEMLHLIKIFGLNKLSLPLLYVGDNDLGISLSEQLNMKQDFRVFKNQMKENAYFLGIVFVYHQNHWFICVIQKISTGVNYVIADSLNTNLFDYADRLNDKHLLELIECLKKK